jgi:hypothetical protein
VLYPTFILKPTNAYSGRYGQAAKFDAVGGGILRRKREEECGRWMLRLQKVKNETWYGRGRYLRFRLIEMNFQGINAILCSLRTIDGVEGWRWKREGWISLTW